MKAMDLAKINAPPSILIFGPFGTFKTGLVSQASGAYLFDFDNGMRTAWKVQDKFTSLRHQIEFDIYQDEVYNKPAAWMRAMSKLQQFAQQNAEGKFKYDGIIIDSLTGMIRAIQLQIMLNATGDAIGPFQRNHWGPMVHQVESFLTILRGIKCLKIVTAHELFFEKEIKSSDGTKILRTEPEYHPMSITKNHSINKLGWLFDEIWHASVSVGAGTSLLWTLSSRSSPGLKCRTRSGFPDKYVHTETGLKGVLEKIGYSYGESNNEVTKGKI